MADTNHPMPSGAVPAPTGGPKPTPVAISATADMAEDKNELSAESRRNVATLA